MRVDAGGVRAGAPLPEFGVINYSLNGWKEWLVLFRRHVGPSFKNFSNPKKVSTLLAKLGPDARHIFESFDVGGDVLYSDLLNLFEEYFATVKGRVTFYSRTQKAEEDFEHYACALKALSTICGFGPCQDAVVRDVFIANLNHRYSELRENLLKESDPTIDELIILCKALSDNSVESPVSAKSDCDSSQNITPQTEIKCNENDSQSMPQTTGNDTRITITDKEAVADVERLNSQALKDISNCNDTLGNSDNKHHQCDSFARNGMQDIKADSGSLLEDPPGKLSDIAGKSEKFDVGNNDRIELPNLYRRKSSSRSTEGSKTANGTSVPNLNPNSDKTTPICADVPKTSVSSRLSKYSSSDRRTTSPESKMVKNELVDTESAINENVGQNLTPTSLTQFMRQCQEISLNNSNNTDGKSKFLSSGTVTSCKIEFSSEDSKNSDARDTKVPNDASHFGPDQCQSPSITSSSERLEISDSSRMKDIPVDPGVAVDPGVSVEAPISASRFTETTVVYIPEEGDHVYVCPTSGIPFMQNLETDLKSRADVLEKVDSPVCGDIYAAPWGDDWYRGRVVDKSGDVVRIVFCDYGNEEDVSSSQLKQLPREYEDEAPLAFPIRPPRTGMDVVFGGQLKVRPIRFAAGAWDVEVKISEKTDY